MRSEKDQTKNFLGRLAQLVERLVYTENVGGSSPSAPISQIHSILIPSNGRGDS